MDKLEFYKLLDEWTASPEYKEYEDLCLSCDTLIKQLENGEKILTAFAKAIDNDMGKRLANEPMFLEFLRKYS